MPPAVGRRSSSRARDEIAQVRAQASHAWLDVALRDVVGLTDPVLSRQLAILMDARYLAQRRAIRQGRQRDSVRLTEEGRRAFAGPSGRYGPFSTSSTRPRLEAPTPGVTSAEAAVVAETPGIAVGAGVKG